MEVTSVYQVTVYKMTYQNKNDRQYKNKIRIASYSTNNIIDKMLSLKKIYKDFNYIIEFNKS